MLYPPMVDNFQPAFVASEYFDKNYQITFQLSDFMAANEFQHVQLKLTYQTNNQTAIKTDILDPTGILFIDKANLIQLNNNKYLISVPSNVLLEMKWLEDTYYKVQIRFGSEQIPEKSEFANWKAEQIKNNNFSEWSSVMILKSIAKPSIQIINDKNIIFSTTPIFYGQYKSNGNEDENLYKFEIWNNDNLIDDSGWIQRKYGEIDSYRSKIPLQNGLEYQVNYQVETINYYNAQSQSYYFRVQESTLNELKDINFSCMLNEEEACVDCFITSTKPLDGIYVLARSDENSNFNIREDLYTFMVFNEQLNNKKFYSDLTILNGVQYKYYLYKQQNNNSRSLPLISSSIQVNFEYAYLIGNQGQQLKLKYNTKLSSFKHVVLENKQNPISGKYPIVQKNGELQYAEFPVSGLISIQADNNNKFLPLFDNNIDINLTPNNLILEKKYRDSVEAFLLDNNYKIFKSPTEGNFIVILTNISLSPVATLNNFLYNFSFTATEIMDYNLDNILSYNIVQKNSLMETSEKDLIVYNTNQIYGSYDSSTNLMKLILDKINDDIGGKFEIVDTKIKNISFESLNDNGEVINLNIDNKIVSFFSNKIYNLTNIKPNSIVLMQPTNIVINFTYECTINPLSSGDILDSFNYSIFNDINQINEIIIQANTSLFKMIQDLTKTEIENKYNTQFSIQDNELYFDSNKTKVYSFLNIDEINLECPERSELEVKFSDNTSTTILIGPTNRLVLDLKEQSIIDIIAKTEFFMTLLDFKYLILYGEKKE